MVKQIYGRLNYFGVVLLVLALRLWYVSIPVNLWRYEPDVARNLYICILYINIYMHINIMKLFRYAGCNSAIPGSEKALIFFKEYCVATLHSHRYNYLTYIHIMIYFHEYEMNVILGLWESRWTIWIWSGSFLLSSI